MAGPWEKFAAQEETGPWAKFSAEPNKPPTESLGSFIKREAQSSLKNWGNRAAGAVRAAAGIGTTLRYPLDRIDDYLMDDGRNRNQERRAALDPGLESLGADPSSLDYQGGKLFTEIAGTAGVGPLLGIGAKALGVAQPMVNALTTAGFRAGPTSGMGNALTRILGGGATGGAMAGLVNPEDAGMGAAIGGGLPGGAMLAGKTAQAVGGAIRGAPVSPEVAALAARAKELGINIPADRLVDSKPMNALASSLNYVPMSGRAAAESAMNTQLNRALSKTFGQDSSNVTMALRKADDALGGQFDDFLRSNTLRVDKSFIDDLAEAANQASKELSADGASIISKQVDDIISKASTGQIDGQAAYNIKKTLDRIGKRNSPEAWYALDLKHKLMDALNRSVGPEKASAFADLRKQYGNMLTLEKLAKNGVDGEVSVARLSNLKGIRNPEIQDLADIAAQFVKGREGQHGAAQRTYGVMGAGLAGYFGGPATVAAGMAAGRGTNMLLNSNAARNAVLGTTNPAVESAMNKLLPLTYRASPVISAQ
jgi:hypothetical protein